MATQSGEIRQYYRGFDGVLLEFPNQAVENFFYVVASTKERIKFSALEKFNRFAVQIEIRGVVNGPVITRVGRSIGPLNQDNDVAFYTDADVVDGNATPELTSDSTVYYDLQIRKLQDLFVEVENNGEQTIDARIFVIADR